MNIFKNTKSISLLSLTAILGTLLLAVVLGGCGSGGSGYDTFVVTVDSPHFYRYGFSSGWYRDYQNGYPYYWAYSTTGSRTNWAVWEPNLPKSANYRIRVYIPWTNSISRFVEYRIYANGRNYRVTIDQAAFAGMWVSLGNYYFRSYSSDRIELSNAAGDNGRKVLFSSVMWEG